MNGFHAQGLDDYLQAIVKCHKQALNDLHDQRRSLTCPEDMVALDAKIKSEIANYKQECRRAKRCLF
jgi:hypothetical protein